MYILKRDPLFFPHLYQCLVDGLGTSPSRKHNGVGLVAFGLYIFADGSGDALRRLLWGGRYGYRHTLEASQNPLFIRIGGSVQSFFYLSECNLIAQSKSHNHLYLLCKLDSYYYMTTRYLIFF